MTNPSLLVTLSSFGEHSNAPVRMLEESGFTFQLNKSGHRMSPDEVVAAGAQAVGIVAGVEPYSAQTLSKLPRLRCISRVGTGIDAIDQDAAASRGIRILATKEAPVQAVAEQTLGFALALLRQIPRVDASMHAGRWERHVGRLLAGRTVGILGLGRIGRRVAELVGAFGCPVVAYDPHVGKGTEVPAGTKIQSLEQVLAAADLVSIHAAHDAKDPLRLGRAELARMKPGSFLINVARGEMVDDAALAAALASGHIAGAALDVFPNEPYRGPLVGSPNCILSPHQATLTVETRIAMETQAVENLLTELARKEAA